MLNSRNFRSSVAFASLAVAGCGLIGMEPPLTVDAKFSSTNDVQIAATAEVLMKRFEDVEPHINSTVSVTRKGESLRFVFEHGAPSRELITALMKTTGRLRVFLKDNPIEAWITERDVVATNATMSDNRLMLAVRVNDTGAKRLLEKTSKNVGRVVTTTVDNRPIVDATISGVFSESFVISGVGHDQITVLKAVLAHGALPLEIQSVSFQ